MQDIDTNNIYRIYRILILHNNAFILFQDAVKDLPIELLRQLVLEMGAIGEGSVSYIKDLLHSISQPDVPIPHDNNLPWCKCGVCAEMEHPDHNKCCNRVICVTSYQIFRKICIDKDVLRLQIMARCDMRAEPMEFSTNSLRKAAYQQFVLWKYGRLGRSNRRILPACVVTMI